MPNLYNVAPDLSSPEAGVRVGWIVADDWKHAEEVAASVNAVLTRDEPKTWDGPSGFMYFTANRALIDAEDYPFAKDVTSPIE